MYVHLGNLIDRPEGKGAGDLQISDEWTADELQQQLWNKCSRQLELWSVMEREVMQQKHPVRDTVVTPPSFSTDQCFITWQKLYLSLKTCQRKPIFT